MRADATIQIRARTRNHPRRDFWSRLTPTCILILALQLTSVSSILGKGLQQTDKDMADLRGDMHRLQQGILQQEQKMSETRSTERNILAELEALDTKLIKQQARLTELETNIAKQQTLIAGKESALDKLRSEKKTVEAHLQKRITAYYTMGDIGLLNVTFSTKTLPELLTFHDAFDVLIKYDQDVIRVYRDTIDELERTTQALDLEKSVMEDFLHQTLQEKELLQQTTTEKKALLTHVQTQEKLHQQAIAEMQQATEEMAKSIVSVKSREQVNEQRFLAAKGSLPPPVDGMLTTLFQQERTNRLGISRKSDGIELQAADGTKIVAVADGEVIFAGYLRGYGNTVILHHGFQYYTVTSRIEKIVVARGHLVKKQERIGITGDTATLFNEGLYFEIRHGRESLDPLLWLSPGRISTLQNHPDDQIDSGNSAP